MKIQFGPKNPNKMVDYSTFGQTKAVDKMMDVFSKNCLQTGMLR